MSADRHGLSLRLSTLWLGACLLWLATGALVPVPPWAAEETLAREERRAHELAADAGRVPVWSLDVGGTLQGPALGDGWGLPEPFVEVGRIGRARRMEKASADVFFDAPAWPEAHVTLRAAPDIPVPVQVLLDGEPRGSLWLDRGSSVASAAIGPVGPGRHMLTLLLPGPDLLVAGVSVGMRPCPDPARDRGFAGVLRVGLDDRPAFFPSSGGARYGFGIGDPASALSPVAEALHGWLSAGLIALLPGLMWAAMLGTRGPARIATALACSALALGGLFVLFRIAGLAPSPVPLASGLMALGSIPLAFVPRERDVRVPWIAVVPTALCLVVLTWFASAVVPPLDDQDQEVQATAHGVAHRLVPATVTDRGTTWYFAHPPLLHLWVAGSFALEGRLARMAYADTLAANERARLAFDEARADRYPPAYYGAWRQAISRFFAEPRLWTTRQVNVLLASIAVGLISVLAAELCGSAWLGLLAAVAFCAFPEVLIRGAYGGYFAADLLLALLLLCGVHERWPALLLAATAAVAFLVDQKELLIPVAWLLSAPRAAGLRRFVPIAGALAGVAVFSAWGLSIDAPTFVHDFWRQHVFRRLVPSDVRLFDDTGSWYPSIATLWGEFSASYGLIFTLAGAAAGAVALRSHREIVRLAGAAVWLGSVVFTLTDWRQTKHLSLLAAPALLAITAVVPRRALAVLLAVILFANLATASLLAVDFESLLPSTIW